MPSDPRRLPPYRLCVRLGRKETSGYGRFSHSRPRLDGARSVRTVRHAGAKKLAIGAGFTLAVLVGAPDASPDIDDGILVPGGTEAVARLLGNVRTDPDEFMQSLNRALLRTVRGSHDWEEVPARVDLVEYLATVQQLQATFTFPLELRGRSPRSAGEFDVLTRILGFDLRSRDYPLELDAASGEFAERRQRIARALGWNLTRIAHALGESDNVVVLEIETDRVEPLLAPQQWTVMTGKSLTPENALAEVAIDQRLGLLVEGLRRQTRESRAALEDQYGWIYRNAAIPFFRYGVAFEIRGGKLVLPGGPETAGAWSSLVGVPTSDGPAFFRQILTQYESSHAHVWSGLYFLPPPVARYWIEQYVAAPYDSSRLDPFLKDLRRVEGAGIYRGTRGAGTGFSYLARSVPFVGNHARPHFPESPALWLYSAEDGDEAVTPDAVARTLARARRDDLEPDETLATIMTRLTSTDGFPALLSGRYVRIAHVFESSPDLLTPEVIVVLGRAAARYPSALDVLERMRLDRPESVVDYFYAIGNLDRLEYGAGREIVLSQFEGGVQLIALLFEGNKTPDADLREEFDRWVEIHRNLQDKDDLLRDQPDWLRSLLAKLPDPGPDAPGRGPLERAWLHAVAPALDPQDVRWGGLTYRGTRAVDLAARMLAALERERIPSLDRVLRFHEDLGKLRSACAGGDTARAHRLATDLIAQSNELVPETRQGPNLGGSKKNRLGQVFRAVLSQQNPRRLAAFDARLENPQLGVARRLRPFLVASAYFETISRIDNVIIADLPLIRRHTVQQWRTVRSSADDPGAPWKPARVVRANDTELGAHVSGHLNGVTAALLGLHVQTHHPGSTKLLGLLTRQQEWYLNAVRSRWHRVTPDVARFAAAAMAAGDELAKAATRETDGQAFEFVASRVPRYRIERQGESGAHDFVITPSERFALGLAVLQGDAHGPPDAALLTAPTRDELIAAAEAISDDPAKIRYIGTPTPHINARATPWVGTWTPYEAIDRESRVEALAERELLDLRLTIIRFLALHDLPGEVGADLEMYVLERAPRGLRLEDEDDWESVIDWLARLDDDYLGQGMRWCMKRGYYRVQDF